MAIMSLSTRLSTSVERLGRLLFIGCVIVGVGAPVGVVAKRVDIDQVVAVVNDEPITLSEYAARHRSEIIQGNQQLEAFTGKINLALLEQIISEKLQLQRALERGLTISDAELENTLKFIAEQNQLSVAALLEELKRNGVTPSQFRANLREQSLIRQLTDATVNSQVVVSELEVDNYLQNHKASLSATADTFEISHLVIATAGKSPATVAADKTRLNQLRQTLAAGGSFEAAVKQSSDGNKEQGGYVGWRKVNELKKPFVDALQRTRVGGVTEVVESENGLHLFKLHKKKDSLSVVVREHKARHILLSPNQNRTQAETLSAAQSLRQRLLQGEKFDKLARLNSDDKSSRTKGGELGWLGPGNTAPELKQTLATLPIGQVSQPILTRFGYHLLEVTQQRNVNMRQASTRNRARQAIFQRKAQERYENWNAELRNAAYIEYIAVSE